MIRKLRGALCAALMLALVHVAPSRASTPIVFVTGDAVAFSQTAIQISLTIDPSGVIMSITNVGTTVGAELYLTGTPTPVLSFSLVGSGGFTSDIPPDNPPGNPATSFASWDADSPPPSKGLKNGETFSVLMGGDSTILNNQLYGGDIVLYGHFIGATNGGSSTFYAKLDRPPGGEDPPTNIAEPASLALFGLAIGGLAAARRRRRGVFDFLKSKTNRPAYA